MHTNDQARGNTRVDDLPQFVGDQDLVRGVETRRVDELELALYLCNLFHDTT